MCRDDGSGVHVAVLAEVLASVVAEAKVSEVDVVHLHTTPSAPVTLGYQVLLHTPTM